MLRPFKSFLNNLQKNAIGATIFGILPDMMNNSEEEEIPNSAIVYNQDDLLGGDDPLSDPLALDDNVEGADYGVNTDVDTSAEGEIILVDVNSLKSAFVTDVQAITKTDTDKTKVILNDVDDKCKLMDNFNGDLNEQNKINVQNDSVLGTILGDSLLDIVDMPDITITAVDNHGNTGDDSQLEIHFEPVNITLVDEVNEEAEGTRSDGSDSGFGLELSSSMNPGKTVMPSTIVPGRSNLKRRSSSYDEADVIEAKRPKRNIQFNGVTVYYFPRIQGFTCIPSQGGCTLGMGPQHFYEKSFTLSEHTAEQKRIHRQKMQELNPTRHLSTPMPTMSNSTDASSSDESDSDEEVISDNSGSDLDIETNGFLQPVSQRQRRAMLKAAGVREIESYEKNECRDIRTSREFCGCNCRGYCDPDTCFCSQSGIKCQVDRASFPCGCTQDGCGNVVGRIEFNPKRVRTHFIHTIMRLELEKKQKKADEHNTLNSYDGRVRLRENGLDTIDGTLPAVQRSTLQQNLNELPAYNNNQTMMYSNGQNSIATGDGLDLTGGACSNSFNSGIVGSGCDPSISESTLDLHYAFRNDYHVGTSPQSPPQIPQQNYMMYNASSYFATSANSAFTDYVLGSGSHGHTMHAPSYPSFTQTSSSFMVPALDSAAISDIIGVPTGTSSIGTFSAGDTSYPPLQNSTSLFGDPNGDDIHTPNRIASDTIEPKIIGYTKPNRSTSLNNNDKIKTVDYSHSLKTEAQRYDAINDFLESSRATDLGPMIPYVALTPLSHAAIMNGRLEPIKTTTNGACITINHPSDSLPIESDDKPAKMKNSEATDEQVPSTQSTPSPSTIANIIHGDNLCEIIKKTVVESVSA